MTDRNYDFQGWFEPYKETFASFTRVQQDGFRTFERFARFQYAVAGDLLEAGLAHARTALGARSTVGTQVIADLLQKQAELGNQLNEKLKARAQEFSAITGDAQESASSFAADTANRAAETASRAAEAGRAKRVS
jgi:hypothetical protein